MDDKRVIWIDWLRVTACFLVMLTHGTEPFYLGGEGTLILTRSDAVWSSVMDVFSRSAVVLFVIASSYLQFPLHYSAKDFFKKRAWRILPPFLVWTLVYALVWGEPIQNVKDLLWNFNYATGHLWFVYMLIGLYLIMPLLSPWAEKVGKRELQVYLGIWLFTTLIPLIRDWLGGAAPIIYGPSGIPNTAKYPLWGEASWNTYGLFYYLSGMVGYMLLGLYFSRFVEEMSWKKTLALALPIFSCGFAIGVFGFLRRVMADAQPEAFATYEAGFPPKEKHLAPGQLPQFCQSCGMPLTKDEDCGRNADGSINFDYCQYCYQDGKFLQECTMEEMIDHCAQFVDEVNKMMSESMTQEQYKDMMRGFFPMLKRWRARALR